MCEVGCRMMHNTCDQLVWEQRKFQQVYQCSLRSHLKIMLLGQLCRYIRCHSRPAGGYGNHFVSQHSTRHRSTCPFLLCYTEKSPNAWQRRGTQKTRNTYNQPNRPNRQTSQTKHQALPKGQPGRRITPNNTAAVHASAQQQPTISTHTRQGHHQIFSANAARSEAQEQYRRAG